MVKIKLRICVICTIILSILIGAYKFYIRNEKQNQKLYNAIEINEVEAAKEAIDDGANKNSFRSISLTMESIYGKSDRNPVYADTVLHKDNQIAQYLVKNGADVNYKKRNTSALDYALSSNEFQSGKKQIELIDYLYKQKTPVTKVTKKILINGYSAGVYGEIPANAEYILQWGIKHKIIKLEDLSEKRQIFYKISMGQEIRSLILKGIFINKLYNTYGENITMVAARYGNLEVLKYAVKNKVSIREENDNSENIFDLAIKSNNIDTIKYVMHIIKPSEKCICESIENSMDSISEKTLEYFLTKLEDINITPEDNDENILETAAMSNRKDLVELLIKKRAVVTPMALINAIDTGNIKLVKIIIDNGGEINKIGKYSDGEKMNSALYEAITTGNLPMIKFLIKHGAVDAENRLSQVSVTSKDGKTSVI